MPAPIVRINDREGRQVADKDCSREPNYSRQGKNLSGWFYIQIGFQKYVFRILNASQDRYRLGKSGIEKKLIRTRK